MQPQTLDKPTHVVKYLHTFVLCFQRLFLCCEQGPLASSSPSSCPCFLCLCMHIITSSQLCIYTMNLVQISYIPTRLKFLKTSLNLCDLECLTQYFSWSTQHLHPNWVPIQRRFSIPRQCNSILHDFNTPWKIIKTWILSYNGFAFIYPYMVP